MNNQLNSNVESEANAIPEYVLAATDWWAKAIANPTHNLGDTSRTGELASMLINMINMRNPITPEQIELFKKALIPLIEEEIETRGSCFLAVDYNPDFSLARAAKEAGIENMRCFPPKTQMYVSSFLVEVSAGASQPYKTLWSKA